MALQLTQAQRAAADPAGSVWVTANAGTGKTKVLTDRVLRLLLEGTEPEKILCLTYTRAAAAEMLTRLQKELANWVKLSDEALNATLLALTGSSATPALRHRARRLFLEVLEAPEGVRILTIHSLCQSLLKRFSLEAGVSPYFRLMEESQTSLLLAEARRLLFTEPRLAQEMADLTPALRKLAARLSEEDLDKLMDEIISKRGVFERWFRSPKGAETARKDVYTALEIVPRRREEIFAEYRQVAESRWEELNIITDLMAAGSTTDQKLAAKLKLWLNHWLNASDALPDKEVLDGYYSAFLTQKHTPTKRLVTKKIEELSPNAKALLEEEQARAIELFNALYTQETAEWSLAVLALAEALLALYAKLKRDKGMLDYDDLIHDTHQLLTKEGIAPWILFKLDSGIDHLLVDEAQDTSPLQWQIIRLLADEFFTGDSAREEERTLFVVGDEKQSIYRFQGADPQEFAEMKQHFARNIQQSGAKWNPVSLSLSFRSTPAVLTLIDAVFADEQAREGVLEEGLTLQHQPFRADKPGRVELWPAFPTPKQEETREPWQVPDSRNARTHITAESSCAAQITQMIRQWLSEARFLPARERAVQAGDILILVRRRSPFYYRLIRSLKAANIPVAGEDRLKLLDQLAVQDVLALCDFLLLPQDDLSLACVLKSPFFDMSEETLFDLSYRRKGSLWGSAQQKAPEIGATLTGWLNKVDRLRPFELLAQILEADGGREKLAARLGVQVHDPLNELLTLARDYERSHPPSLQGFLQELRREEISIKRELGQAGDEVRVMTVHGSKGLQAPIVILPDTIGKPDPKDKLLWTQHAALFTQDEAMNTPAVKALKEVRKTEEHREYRRLLYVALTRAADELYVTGWLDGKTSKVPEGCWYDFVHKAMEKAGEEEADGKWVLGGPVIASERSERGNLTQQIASSHSLLAMTKTLPHWIHQPMPEEPSPPRPLMPSRPQGTEPAQNSPLSPTSDTRRGTLIHRLLEILPDIPPHQRQQSAEILLKKQGIAESERQQWTQEVLAILNHPDFAPLFEPGSLAEVPVTAMLSGQQIISGQIDRLVELEDRMLIIDYKTSQNVPETEAQVPAYFRAQMQAYRDALTPIYPHKRIEVAILWTHAPKLMPLSLAISSE